MRSSILKKMKRIIPTSLMSLLMLTSCATNANNSSNENSVNSKDDLNILAERVDFNELLKNVTIGYEEHYNDSVLVSSATPNAKLLNQEISVIIEMDGNSTVDTYLASEYDSFPEFYGSKRAIKQENEMVDKQSKLAAELLKAGLLSEVYGNYSTLLNGFYGKTTYGKLDQIRSFANVKEAYVSTRYAKPTGVVSNNTNVDPATGIYINDSQYDGSNTIVAVLDSGFDYTHEVFNMEIDKPAKTKNDISEILESTMAYKIESNKGSKLSVNDVYLSSKVPFAYDYSDKKCDVFPVESDHGTHVSGIIGGESSKIKGIAPNTQFAWMKVFSDDDTGGDSVDILSALEDAVTIGVDAINMSLGAVGGYSVEVIPSGELNSLEERTNKIYQQISDVGVSLITAAGNEYSSGYQSEYGTNVPTNPEAGTISSPGSYNSSLTVASINGTLDPYALVNGSDSEAVFFRNAFDSKQVEHKFTEELFEKINKENLPRNADGSVDIEYVTVPGFGAKVNYTGLNVKGKIALVKRGNLSFEEKLKQAYAAGAFAVIIYNNVSGSLSMTIGPEAYIPISLISLDAGTKLAKKSKGKLTFKEDYKSGPFMSDFSSWGPLANLTLKPEITAHGGNIYSAILGGDYDEMSGTSMATPNACGIVLVIRDYVKETWPELSPKEVTQMVNRLLMSTATICLNEVGNPYSPRKQGAGLASLLNSTSTDAYLYVEGIDKTKLELGDDKQKTGIYECEFNISNISDHPVIYDVSNLTMTETVSSDEKAVAETAYMLNPSMDIKVAEGLTKDGTKVTVPANTDAKIKVTLALNKEDMNYIDTKFKNGMYVEGYITLTATQENQVNLSIPFLAFYGDWLQAPMFDKTYYEVEADRVNGAISEKDKTKADLYASTPYGKYGLYYMVPLGGYIYEYDSGYSQIPATVEKASISIDSETAIYQLYTVYTGLLRGAKKMTMTITNSATGEVVYEKITYNNRKATYYGSAGSTIPYIEDYSFNMFNEETGQIFANNAKYDVRMVAELDYEDGDKAANNVFDFSFYVDYETPTLENVRYITEWDKSTKKNRYYLELDVSDNRFVQAIRPCAISNKTLVSLIDNPIPVYQETANTTTTVKIEITNYFADLKNSEYPDTIFFMINDYALNSNIFLVPLGGCDYEGLKFNESTIEIKKNEVVNLNEHVNFENAMLQGLTWTSSNNNIAIVGDAEVIGLKQGLALITGTSPSYNTSIQVKVKVLDSNSTYKAGLSNAEFGGYTTLFSFDDDFEFTKIGSAKEGDTLSYMPNNNMFEIYPSESFKLKVNLEPWYFDKSSVEIKWTSSNTNYVAVEDGVVTALKETVSPISIKAIIYVDGKETVFSASTTVVVKSPFIHSGIMLQYYKGFGGVVEIPDDLGIEYIGEYAFSHYNYNGIDEDGYAVREPIGDNTSTPITKIIVPEGVKIIQKHAFSNLTHLQEVVLPSTIKDIYVSAFENCKSLEKINLNHAVKIESNAFNNCVSLTTINAENDDFGKDLSNVVTAGSNAFNNTNIEKIDLIRLRMAGESVFANCKNLKSVTLYSENPLKENMFANSSITSITIPHGIIPKHAFANCDAIKEVVFTNNNVVISDEAFKGCSSLNSIKFADDCKSLYIGYNAFEDSTITSLELPSCEVTLSDEAFKNSSIKELVLNENTKLVLNGAPFVATNSFDSININGTNIYYNIVNSMLVNKAEDTLILVPSNVEITLPSTIKYIECGAASGNKVTTSLVIPSTLLSVGDYAFANSSLTSIDFTNAQNCDFATYVFYGCEDLATLTNLTVLSSINEYMFAYSGLNEATIGNNVEIKYGAFACCDKLENVTIGENVNINDYAFYHSFVANSTLTISSGIIGHYAFADSHIGSVKATNISEIGVGAFMNCKDLLTVSIPNTNIVSPFAFFKCERLNEIDISNATTISHNAFANDKSLVKVTGNNLVTISDKAFADCTSLANINLKTATAIYDEAFIGCASLVTVDLSNIAILGVSAFEECISLTAVENLEKAPLTIIPESCFFHDSSLDTYTSLASINLSHIKEIGDAAFSGNTSLDNLDLSNVEKIGSYAFYASYIYEANLSSCLHLGDYAFYATPVREISIPKLITIGECAFAETNTNKVDIPETLTSIKYGSFSAIKRLSEFTHNNETNYVKYDENNNPVWTIVDGVLYTYLPNGKLQLQAYPINSDRTSYRVLDGTVRIDAYSFYVPSGSSIKLTEVYLPNSLEFIGDSAFAGAEAIKDYYFESYKAPLLECVYNPLLQNYLASLTSVNQITNNLYHINDSTIYNMYFYYYPYYYSNFYDYVGFVDFLTIHYPKNGVGYNSLIYKNYFVNKVQENIVSDDVTNRAIKALENIFNFEKATSDNKDAILDIYNYYLLVTDKEQLALLDATKVNHLLDLYEQIIDMENPTVPLDEIKDFVGTYGGVDSENTTYLLTINEDGTGTLIVDNELNDAQDVTLKFSKIRRNGDKLQITTENNETFIFEVNKENRTIKFKYYTITVDLEETKAPVDPTPVEPTTPTDKNYGIYYAFAITGGIIALCGIVLAILMALKKKKLH